MHQAYEAKRSRHSLTVFFELLGRFRLEYGGILIVLSLLAATEGIFHPLLIKSIFDEVVARGSFKRFVILARPFLHSHYDVAVHLQEATV